MNKYELLYIISSDAPEEAREAIIKKFSDMVVADGGVVDSVEKIGMKKFAYPIQDKAEGYYVLMNFESEAEFPAELDRVYKITDGVLRSLIIKKGE